MNNPNDPNLDNYIVTICAYCGKIMSTIKDSKRGISHGICKKCLKIELNNFKKSQHE